MAQEPGDIRENAVLLRDDSLGVSTEKKPRKIQQNGKSDSYSTTLPPKWLRQLGLDAQGELTLHSVSLGVRPVIVQNPAIIIQPASAIRGNKSDD